MERSSILMATTAPLIARAVKRALSSAGYRVSQCSLERAELESRLAAPVDLLILNADTTDLGDLSWILGRFRELHPDGAALLVSADLGNFQIIDQVLSHGLNNLIGKHGAVSASYEYIDEAELIATVDKVIRKDIFGLEKYVSPRICVRSCVIRSSRERAEALVELQSFLDDTECYRSIEPMILTAADELLMNAIFSAPRDADGRPKYEEIERSASLSLEPHEYVDLSYACDGRSVYVAVGDQAGSLERATILSHLTPGLTSQKMEVQYKKGGAGIGLYMVARSMTQLVFNIEKDVRTEVIASFYVRSGLRGFRSSGRSLNLFVLKDRS